MSKPKGRILLAKAGLDGHDRGIKIIARALRDAGYEIIYTGLHRTPEMIVETALQEDVDAIGVSVLSGAHDFLFRELVRLLKENKMDDVALFGGGIIPDHDIAALKKIGVKELFTPGTPTDAVLKFLDSQLK
jgi:methylmalonyl-CoA mutase C-terminal domain/subunit